jgi:Polyketide cyclase / dehydrase and lipid transport
MPDLFTEFVVAAPADAVWDVIGRRFDRIGEWATAIPASTALPPSAETAATQAVTRLPVGQIVGGAPVVGRVCTTGVRLVPRVTETLVAYDETNRTLTYEGSGLPAFVTTARNTWTVTPLDEPRCRVTLRARFVTRGLLGHLGRWAILAQVGRTSRYLADDLRHYVETGRPSPRKQRQLRRAARRAAR